jgi:hypothetical protein
MTEHDCQQVSYKNNHVDLSFTFNKLSHLQWQ